MKLVLKSPPVDGVQPQHMRTQSLTTLGSIVKRVIGTQNQLLLHIQELKIVHQEQEQQSLENTVFQ